jgi:hypothetical protein
MDGGHDATPSFNNLAPLRNIAIAITVEGVRVTGEIVTLYPNDLNVIITSPISGLGTGLHVPHFAMGAKALATMRGYTTDAINEHGQRQAERLLGELYAHTQGKGTGWGVYAVGSDGWTRLDRDGGQ